MHSWKNLRYDVELNYVDYNRTPFVQKGVAPLSVVCPDESQAKKGAAGITTRMDEGKKAESDAYWAAASPFAVTGLQWWGVGSPIDLNLKNTGNEQLTLYNRELYSCRRVYVVLYLPDQFLRRGTGIFRVKLPMVCSNSFEYDAVFEYSKASSPVRYLQVGAKPIIGRCK